MQWVEGFLRFSLFTKPNQELKYLNMGSTHTASCMDAGPKGVLDRYVRLTLVRKSWLDNSVKGLFPYRSRQ